VKGLPLYKHVAYITHTHVGGEWPLHCFSYSCPKFARSPKNTWIKVLIQVRVLEEVKICYVPMCRNVELDSIHGKFQSDSKGKWYPLLRGGPHQGCTTRYRSRARCF